MSQELKDVHDLLHAKIDEIDVKLDSLLDPATAGKTRIINERVAMQKERADKVVANFVTQLESSPIDEKIGMYYALVQGLNAAYKEPISAAIEELVKNQPKVEPLVSETEGKELAAVRSDLATKVKQLIGMASIFGDTEGFHEPKKRTGKAGKRGPRALSLYSFSIGDKEYEDLNAVAADFPQYFGKGSDIAAAMRGDFERPNPKTGVMEKVRGIGKNADGTANTSYIDTTTPPDEFSFTLPDGNVLIATKDDESDDPDAPIAEGTEESE